MLLLIRRKQTMEDVSAPAQGGPSCLATRRESLVVQLEERFE
jgi:hypothetical protein